MKECNTCHLVLDETEFPRRKHSNTFRTSCRSCENKARRARGLSDNARKNRTAYSIKFQKKQRQDPKFASKFIVRDSRNADKKHGMENDLTRDLVSELIKNGCSYCGDNSIRMTLDRIDNGIGHIQSNVVPACYRCNMIRGNMPYEAWINIIPVIRETLEKGLFQEWTGFGPWKSAGSG